MGQLITMPPRNTETEATVSSKVGKPAEVVCIDTAFPKPVEAPVEEQPQSVKAEWTKIDFSVWKNAPKERTPAYFPTYRAVSRAMQAAMRGWVREWFQANPDVLKRPRTAYPILVYQCTIPYSGKRINMFTYDIQETEALHRAFASAACKLSRELKALDTKRFKWFTREYYFAYRSKEVVKYVMKNRRGIYRMLNVDTVLMDSILKFAIIDLPTMELEDAVRHLRRAFEVQLNRFSSEFDLSRRADQLLKIATDALVTKLAQAQALEAPEDLPLAA